MSSNSPSVLDETRLTTDQAARRCHVDPATIYRWYTKGLRGVSLEAKRVGRTLVTSHEALERFFDRLTELDRRTLPAHSSTARRVSHRATEADREAEAEGL